MKAEIGDANPKGLVVQFVAKREEGGLRHFNVWESKEDWERYQQERVEPAVARVLAGIGVTQPSSPRLPVEELNVIDLMTTTS